MAFKNSKIPVEVYLHCIERFFHPEMNKVAREFRYYKVWKSCSK